MAKKKRAVEPKPSAQDKPATLKDLLSPEVLGKLKLQADEMKAAEANQKAEARKAAEAERQAEQKRLENNFEYLLNHSDMKWDKFK